MTQKVIPTDTVPYTALGEQVEPIRQELVTRVDEVIKSGRYILGPEVDGFEEEFAAYCGSQFAVGLGSGTDALLLALRGLGLGDGDEVITVPNSFIASTSTIALAGARPVFVDVGEDMNIDPNQIEAAITGRTKAIAPVHLTGRPVRMKEVCEIADRHNLFVIEDAAQAVGARLDGRRVGSLGRVGCFSLHPLKNLFAFGDAGMATTDDASLYEEMRMARNHGLRTRDSCEYWSFNCRLDAIQAALLRVTLQHLEEWTEQRRSLALRYNDRLRQYVTVPDEGPNEYCVYQTYMVQADHRDKLQKFLRTNGVEALVHYPTPIHHQPAAKGLGYAPADFPIATRLAARIMSLPLYPTMTHDQQDRVVSLIGEFYESHGH